MGRAAVSSLMEVDAPAVPLRRVEGSLRRVDESLRCVDESLRCVDESLRGVDESLRGVDESLRCAEESLRCVEGSLPCVDGERSGWPQLHRRYYPIAAAFLRKLGVGERDLEDTCQEVFLQMFRYLASFRGDADPRTWLYRLCVTQARRVRRRERLARVLQNVLAFLPGESLVSSPCFSEVAAQRQIEAALARLSEKERSAFVLYEMEGLSGKEIAAILGCKEATLWRRLHDARRVFREALGVAEAEP